MKKSKLIGACLIIERSIWYLLTVTVFTILAVMFDKLILDGSKLIVCMLVSMFLTTVSSYSIHKEFIYEWEQKKYKEFKSLIKKESENKISNRK